MKVFILSGRSPFGLSLVYIKELFLYLPFMAHTMCIKLLADSANFKAVTHNENCNGLTGLLSEMPNVSYT